MIYIIDTKPFIINEKFENEYDNWNKIDRNGKFLLGETSQALLDTGLLKQKIYIDKSKLLKIRNKHQEMNDNIIKKIPDILNNPVIVLKSESVVNRIVLFSEIQDDNNNPILVAMELNPYENINNVEKIYKVVSSYPKDNYKSMEKWINNKDNILYIDNKKINKWISGLGLRLPVPLKSIDLCNKSIAQHYNKINVTIKDLPDQEKPRERAIKYGVDKLSNEELLSIILKTGIKNSNVKMLASNILS